MKRPFGRDTAQASRNLKASKAELLALRGSQWKISRLHCTELKGPARPAPSQKVAAMRAQPCPASIFGIHCMPWGSALQRDRSSVRGQPRDVFFCMVLFKASC